MGTFNEKLFLLINCFLLEIYDLYLYGIFYFFSNCQIIRMLMDPDPQPCYKFVSDKFVFPAKLE